MNNNEKIQRLDELATDLEIQCRVMFDDHNIENADLAVSILNNYVITLKKGVNNG